VVKPSHPPNISRHRVGFLDVGEGDEAIALRLAHPGKKNEFEMAH